MTAIRWPKSAIVIGGGERVEHRAFEVEVVVDPTQDHVKFADDQLEHIDLGFQDVQDPLLDAALGHQVREQHIVDLADAVQPAKTLFDLHRIPRQIDD